MARLTWDEIGERFYETGIDHGVLYIPDVGGIYATGVSWNGLISVTESPSGAEPSAQYADNIKYLNLYSAEEFAATLEAFTYPPEFQAFDGLGEPAGAAGMAVGQQSRGVFGLSYRTIVGNDLEANDHAYKLHLVYGCQASPSEKAFTTVNNSPEPVPLSWEIATTPAPMTGFKPTSLITVDSRAADPTALSALEDTLYGELGDPSLPTPDEVVALLTP